MPRTARAIVPGHWYHFINRGNNRADLFHDRADYCEFLWLMAEASDRVPMPVIGACLMPNHLHLVVRPLGDDDLARWTRWLFTTHSRRYHMRHGTSGRVWQGRYKAFAIQHDAHFLIVLRYVERNAMRANLTDRAERWEWGSLNWRQRSSPPLALADSPVALPADWVQVVNTPHTEDELEALRNSVNRQCPFGTADWVATKAAEFGMEASLAPLGRPRRRM